MPCSGAAAHPTPGQVPARPLPTTLYGPVGQACTPAGDAADACNLRPRLLRGCCCLLLQARCTRLPAPVADLAAGAQALCKCSGWSLYAQHHLGAVRWSVTFITPLPLPLHVQPLHLRMSCTDLSGTGPVSLAVRRLASNQPHLPCKHSRQPLPVARRAGAVELWHDSAVGLRRPPKKYIAIRRSDLDRQDNTGSLALQRDGPPSEFPSLRQPP